MDMTWGTGVGIWSMRGMFTRLSRSGGLCTLEMAKVVADFPGKRLFPVGINESLSGTTPSRDILWYSGTSWKYSTFLKMIRSST